MIAEDLLERGLADAASEYDVPDGAVERLRQQIAPTAQAPAAPRSPQSWRTFPPNQRGWFALAAAVVVLLIAIPIALGGGGGADEGGSGTTPAAGRIHHSLVDRTSGAKSARRLGPVPAPSAVAGATTGGLSGAGASAATAPGSTTNDSLPEFGAATPGSVEQHLVPAAPDKVIKTGELDLQVPKGQVSTTLDRLTGIATLERGYVADSRTSEGGFAPSGQVTLRVPVASFEDSISRARKIAGVKVLALETSGKDVTSKYFDLKARMKALKSTRATFLTLLSKATTIGETLAVQQHVTDVQTQIEQLQGQLKVLNNRSALSTLTVTVDQKTAAQTTTTHEKSGLHKAFDRSVSRFVHGVEAIVGVIGPLLLAGLLVGAAWLAARFGYRRLRRRMV